MRQKYELLYSVKLYSVEMFTIIFFTVENWNLRETTEVGLKTADRQKKAIIKKNIYNEVADTMIPHHLF